jgi:tetratricopeptide (TPR) repeat protein
MARRAVAGVAVLVLAALAVGTWRQVGVWRDGVSLWERALAVGGHSTVIENNLGVALEQDGRLDEAAAHFAEAIRLEPRNARAHSNLGNVRFAQKRFEDAIPAYDDALRLAPGLEPAQQNAAKAHYNLANAAWRAGDLAAAVREYREAIRLAPNDAALEHALGVALLQLGRRDEALAAIHRSLALDPENAYTHDVLALALYQAGDLAGAWREVQACRAKGGTPTPSLVAELAKRMPEPR